MLLINLLKDDGLSLVRDMIGNVQSGMSMIKFCLWHLDMLNQYNYRALQLKSHVILTLSLLHPIHIEIVKFSTSFSLGC